MTDQQRYSKRDSVSAEDLARSYSSYQPMGTWYHSTNRWIAGLLALLNAASFYGIIGWAALLGVYLGPDLIPGQDFSDTAKMVMGGPLGAIIGFWVAIYFCGLWAMLFTYLRDVERIAISSELRARN